MSTKILLTNKNSPWGIINKIVGDNVYENIISFPNLELRDEFINDQLFNGGDYKTLFDNEKNISRTFINELESIASVQKNSYPNETFNSLLNKDYAIIEETNKNVKKYYFFSITSSSVNNSVIEYSLELDIFFTYPSILKNIDNEILIERAHVNRSSTDTYLFENELGNKFSPTYLKSQEELLMQTNSENNENNERIDEILNSFEIIVCYKLDDGQIIFENDSTNLNIGYSINISFKPKQRLGTNNFRIKTQDNVYLDDGSYYNSNNNLPNTYFHITDMFDLNKYLIDTVLDVNNDNEVILSPINENITIEGSSIKINKIKSVGTRIQNYTKSINGFIKPKWEDTPNKDNIKDIKYELKLKRFSQFSLFNLSSNQGTYDFRPEYIDWDTSTNIDISRIYYLYGFQPDNYIKLFTIFENDDNNFITKKGLLILNNLDLPTKDNQWKDYVRDNKISSKSGIIGDIAAPITGAVGGAVAGSIVPGLGTIIGASVGATTGILKGVKGVIKRQDVKQTPDKYAFVSSSFVFNDLLSADTIEILKYELPPIEEEVVYNYLYKYGYNIQKLDNINDYLESRYYFNFIQAKGSFSSISGNYSTRIKQLVDSTLQNGVTLWHYRDKNDWKGVNNYKYENAEMDI